MKRFAILAALVAAACGGGGGSKTNPATAASFNYAAGTPVAPTAVNASVQSTASALSSLTSFQTAPSAASAADVNGALLGAADTALGGSAGLAAAPLTAAMPLLHEVRTQALTLGDVPGSSLPAGCGVLANGTVTFDPAVCKVSQTSTVGTSTTTVTATLSGHVTGAPGSATWDLVINATITEPQLSVNATFTDLGNFAVTDTTAKAHGEASIQATANANGQSATIGVAQAADLDVTIAPPATCSTRITGGTFEAKRVWTALPSQLQGQPGYTNQGVKVTWNGCSTTTPATAVAALH
jgi:hypothetical protein